MNNFLIILYEFFCSFIFLPPSAARGIGFTHYAVFGFVPGYADEENQSFTPCIPLTNLVIAIIYYPALLWGKVFGSNPLVIFIIKGIGDP